MWYFTSPSTTFLNLESCLGLTGAICCTCASFLQANYQKGNGEPILVSMAFVLSSVVGGGGEQQWLQRGFQLQIVAVTWQGSYLTETTWHLWNCPFTGFHHSLPQSLCTLLSWGLTAKTDLSKASRATGAILQLFYISLWYQMGVISYFFRCYREKVVAGKAIYFFFLQYKSALWLCGP